MAVETLRRALEGVPDATWADSNGDELTSREILSTWPSERLDRPVEWSDDSIGTVALRSEQTGSTLLTMLPPTGLDIPSPPTDQQV